VVTACPLNVEAIVSEVALAVMAPFSVAYTKSRATHDGGGELLVRVGEILVVSSAASENG